MITFVVRRLVQGIGVLFVVTLLAFAMMRYVGDPVHNMVGRDATRAERKALRTELGLDRPLVMQYATFLERAAQGRLGTSYRTYQAVGPLIARRLPATLELGLCAALIAVTLGGVIGYRGATRPHDISTRLFYGGALLGVSVPTFLSGLLLVAVFAGELGWLPASGRGTVVDLGWWRTGLLTGDGLAALVLPVTTLALFEVAVIARLVRGELRAALQRPHVRTARALGVPERRVNLSHALATAMVPVITMGGLETAHVLAFAIVTETLFNWPGIGRLFLESVAFGDIPVINAYLMVVASIFIVANLVVDVAAAAWDPRLRTPWSG